MNRRQKTKKSVPPGAWGTVVVTRGSHRGRIGTYDDDADDAGRNKVVVYFGDLFRCKGYYLFPRGYLSPVTTRDLWLRYEEISKATGIGGEVDHGRERSELLDELTLINEELPGGGLVCLTATTTAISLAFVDRQTVRHRARHRSQRIRLSDLARLLGHQGGRVHSRKNRERDSWSSYRRRDSLRSSGPVEMGRTRVAGQILGRNR
jgi:hypothetical protein